MTKELKRQHLYPEAMISTFFQKANIKMVIYPKIQIQNI